MKIEKFSLPIFPTIGSCLSLSDPSINEILLCGSIILFYLNAICPRSAHDERVLKNNTLSTEFQREN